MEMPRPTHAHQLLEKFAGSWEGEDVMHPSPWDPEGGKATGRFERRMALEGFSLIGDYEQEREGRITFRGHAVYTYDTAAREYVVYWWDSMGMPANVYRGQLEGDALVVECDEPQGRSRITTRVTGKDTLHFLMEHSPDGRTWSTCMESVYQKKG